MSTTIRMTLIGMTEHYPTLFDGLELPDGYNKEDFIDSLLLEHGEKGVIYSNPIFFASAIGVWGRKWSHELERIRLALYEDYNPLHNFDRNEVYTDERTGGKSTAHDFVGTGSNNETYTLTSDATYSHERKSDETISHERKSDETLSHERKSDETISHERKSDETLQHVRENDETMQHERDTNSETEEKTSAFNSSDYEPSKQTIESGGNYTDTRSGGDFTDTTSGGDYLDTTSGGDFIDTTSGGDYLDTTSGGDFTDTTSGGNYTDNHATTSRDAGTESTIENDNTKHTGHLFGNIGITESTTMLAHEVETRMKYNLYEIASRMFANEFLINIY